MEIKLSFNEDHFRKAFFADKDLRIHKFESTKTEFVYTLILLSTTVLLNIMVLLGIDVKGLAGVSIVFFLVSLLVLWHKYSSVIRWKRDVNRYIKKNLQLKVNSITLNDEFVFVKQDETEIFLKWDAFNKYVANKAVIQLSAKNNTDILIPKVWLTAEELEWLLTKLASTKENNATSIWQPPGEKQL